MASGSWIDEIAREELKKLENQHPDRFNSLKSELKLFISDPKLEAFFVLPEPIIPLYPSTQSLPTQGLCLYISNMIRFYIFLLIMQRRAKHETEFSSFSLWKSLLIIGRGTRIVAWCLRKNWKGKEGEKRRLLSMMVVGWKTRWRLLLNELRLVWRGSERLKKVWCHHGYFNQLRAWIYYIYHHGCFC